MTTQKEIEIYAPVNRDTIRSMKGLVTPDSNFYKVDFELINPDTIFNERDDYGNIGEFADDIYENGLLQPLIGTFVDRNGTTMFDLSDGFRRYAAIVYNKEKGREVGQILVQNKKMSLEERYITMFATQHHSMKLSPLATSNLLRKLVNLGVKVEVICKRISKSTTYVNDMLELSLQTQYVKDAVNSGQTTPTAVNIISKKLGPDKTKKLVEESISKNEKFTVEKAKDVKVESTMKKLNFDKLEFSKPSEIEVPKTLEGMRIVRDELLALKERSHKQVKFLNDLIAKIKIREEMEATPVANKVPSNDIFIGAKGGSFSFDEIALFKQSKDIIEKSDFLVSVQKTEISYKGMFDTILWTKFCSQYCEKLGMDTCKEIFNLFKEELS